MATVRDKSRYASTSEDGRLHRRALWLCAGDSLCCDGLARFADGTRRARGYRAAGRFTVTPFSAWSAGARDTGSGPSRCRWWSPLELRGGIYVLRWEGPGVARRYVKEPGKRGSPKTAPWFACSSETGGGSPPQECRMDRRAKSCLRETRVWRGCRRPIGLSCANRGSQPTVRNHVPDGGMAAPRADKEYAGAARRRAITRVGSIM